MKYKLTTFLLMVTSVLNFRQVLYAEDDLWRPIYDNAITGNVPGKVNIHPVTYNLDGIIIAANVYTPADYNPAAKQYPDIIIAHPNGGTKYQVAGLFSQHMAEKGYITIAAYASFQGSNGGKSCHTPPE